MKTNFFLSFLAFLTLAAMQLQAQKAGWSAALSSHNGYTYVENLSKDENGNMYLAGSFTGSLPEAATTNSADNNNKTKALLLKYSPQGQLLWTRTAGGTGDCAILGSATSPEGETVVTGYFTKEVEFSGNTKNIRIDKEHAVFVAKYDESGELLWVQHFETKSGSHPGNSIDVDEAGNIFLAGKFYGALTIENTTYTVSEMSVGPEIPARNAMFFIKFTSAGKVIWVKNMPCDQYVAPAKLVVDQKGEVYISAVYQGNMNISDEETLSAYAEGDDKDAFIAKFSANGEYVWSKTFCGKQGQYINSLNIDPQNNLMISGGFNSSCTFGGEKYISIDAENNDGNQFSMFIFRLNSDGEVLWKKFHPAETGGHIYAGDVWNDAEGNTFVSGHFSKQITFSTVEGKKKLVSDAESYAMNAFVLKLNRQGETLWAETIRSNGYSYGSQIIGNKDGSIFCGGLFSGSASYEAKKTTARFNAYNEGIGFYLLALQEKEIPQPQVEIPKEKKILTFRETTQSDIAFEIELPAENTVEPVSAKEAENRPVVVQTLEQSKNLLMESPVKNIEVELFPNPATQQFQLRLKTENQGSINLVLYTMQGQILSQKRVVPNAGILTETYDVSAYMRGTYILRITDNHGFQQVYRVVLH